MTDTEPTRPTTVTITVDGQRRRGRSTGELVIAAGRARRHLHPALLLPPAHAAGRHVPHVPRRDRHRPRARRCSPRCMIPVAPDMKVDTELRRSRRRPRTASSSSSSSTTRSTARCATRAASARCRTRRWPTARARAASSRRSATSRSRSRSATSCYLDRERCILCDRCTRFAKEVAGDPLIHFIDRGNETQVNTFPDDPFASYFSGNTVQICPVGALTATPYRFKARPWDLEQVESTCTSCSVGCRVVVAVVAQPGAALPRRRHRPGQLGLAVRQGPLRLRGRQPRRPARPSRCCARRRRRAGRGPLGRGARRGGRAPLEGGSTRSGPGGVAVLGGARLTNEDAYAWAKLAKGVSAPTTSTPSSATACRPSVVLGLPRATIDEACAPGGTVVLLGPDLKEELPVLYLRLRHAVVEDGVTVVELSPAPTGLDELAVTSRALPAGRGRPRRSTRCSAAADAAGRRRRRARGRGPSSVLRGGDGHRRPRPASLAESGDDTVAAAAGHRSRPAPAPGSCPPAPGQRARRARHGPGARAAARPGRARRRPRLVRRPRGRRVPGRARPRRHRHPRRPRPTGASTTLVLLGADPLADFPDRDLAAPGARRRRHRHRRRHLPHRVGRRGRRRAAGGRLRRGRRHHHQPRGPGQPARPEGHAARHGPADWMIAAELAAPPRRATSARVARATSGPRSRLAPPAGITLDLRRDGWPPTASSRPTGVARSTACAPAHARADAGADGSSAAGRRRATRCASSPRPRALRRGARSSQHCAVARRSSRRADRGARSTRPTSTASASTPAPRCGSSTARGSRHRRGRARPRRARGAPPSIGFNHPASAAADLIDATDAGHRRPGGAAVMRARRSIRCSSTTSTSASCSSSCSRRSSCFAFLLVAVDADDLVRAQAHRRHAEPHRPEPGRAVRASSRRSPTASSSSSRRT